MNSVSIETFKVSRRGLRGLIAAAAVCLTSMSTTAFASHTTDPNIDAILGNGNGVFSNSYIHSALHDWYTFDLTAGNTVGINLSSVGGNSYIWLYQVLNEPLQVGDILGTDYALVAQGGGSTNNTLNYTATGPTAGQFVIQVDSFNGLNFNYTLTVSGASAVPEPISLALVGLGMLGLGWSRRTKA